MKCAQAKRHLEFKCKQGQTNTAKSVNKIQAIPDQITPHTRYRLVDDYKMFEVNKLDSNIMAQRSKERRN